jgi:hypothetical protein
VLGHPPQALRVAVQQQVALGGVGHVEVAVLAQLVDEIRGEAAGGPGVVRHGEVDRAVDGDERQLGQRLE